MYREDSIDESYFVVVTGRRNILRSFKVHEAHDETSRKQEPESSAPRKIETRVYKCPWCCRVGADGVKEMYRCRKCGQRIYEKDLDGDYQAPERKGLLYEKPWEIEDVEAEKAFMEKYY